MKFLYFLESIRNGFCDFFFSTVTHIGEETFFLVFAILFFWCINKREGYYILTVGLVGTVINQALKLMFKIERPWVRDPSFEPVESAKPEATGYSFPSGHTQNATGTFGAIARYSSRPWVRIVCIAVVILVGFSRMYLGVHTPADVCVSLLVGTALVFGLYPFFKSEERFNKFMPYVVGVCTFLTLAYLVYVNLLNPADFDEANLASGMKNGATLMGCMLGLCVVYPLDRFVIKFKTEANWYSQVIKLAVGLGIVLLIKSLFKAPLEAFFGLFTDTPEYIARGVRYFLIVLFAGSVWPLTFNFFSKLHIPFMDKFTSWLVSKFSKNSTRQGT